MIVRKLLLVAAAAALMSTPAWALPSQAPSNQGTAHAPSTTPVGPPSTTPNNSDNPGSANRHAGRGEGDGGGRGHQGDGTTGPTGPTGATGPTGPSHGHGHGKTRKCLPHSIAYVARGTLVGQTLTKNADGTYSGELVVAVTHTNHHAAGDRGKTVTYSVKSVHVAFGLPDQNKDGGVGLDDLATGDRVHLIGRITVLAKKCGQGGFIPTTTIKRIVFHGPAGGASGGAAVGLASSVGRASPAIAFNSSTAALCRPFACSARKLSSRSCATRRHFGSRPAWRRCSRGA